MGGKRKRYANQEESKQAKVDRDRTYKYMRLNLGSESERFKTLAEKSNYLPRLEFVTFLMDRYVQLHGKLCQKMLF